MGPTRVDDARQNARLLEALAVGVVHRVHVLAERGHEILDHAVMRQRVIRRQANLAGVGNAAPGDLAPGLINVRGLVDDDRILAAHFQREGGEMLRSGTHDDATDTVATDVEEVIERQLQQVRRDFRAAHRHRELIFLEHRLDDVVDHISRQRRQFGRLEPERATSGDGAEGQHEGFGDRCVPGRNVQHHALGLVADVALLAQRHDRTLDRLVGHP